MNETTMNVNETTSVAENETTSTVVAPEAAPADPATAVAAETTSGNFLSAHKGAFIKAGIGMGVAVAAGFIIKGVVKHHALTAGLDGMSEGDKAVTICMREINACKSEKQLAKLQKKYDKAGQSIIFVTAMATCVGGEATDAAEDPIITVDNEPSEQA